MFQRPMLIAGLAIAAATAIVASSASAGLGPSVSGPDGNTQAIGGAVFPKKLSTTSPTPVALKVTTKTSSLTAANKVPSPAVRAVIDFDKGGELFTKGLPTCDPALLQDTSTEIALEMCGKAKIGGGTASALLPVGSQVFPVAQTVTAFNGAPQAGKPVIIFHTYGTTPVATTFVIVGKVTRYGKEGYGPRLDLNIPLIAGGAGALTEFQTTINKRWTYKGKEHSYVSAKCTSGKLKARGAFTYKDGETLTAFSTQACTKKK